MKEGIFELRKALEGLDRELVELLARRFSLAAELGRRKAQAGLPVEDLVRESELHALHAGDAEEAGLSPEMVREIFETVLRYSKEVQRRSGSDSS